MPLMRVLLAHNHYQQPGGEDQSFAAEVAMLRAEGHDVTVHTVHNDSVSAMSKVGAAARTVWNGASYRTLRELMRRTRPEVAHFNNTFPLISPAAYYAARAEGVPVVQSLRNYRLLCPDALFFRDGHVCEECMGRAIPWPGVAHACYRNSRAATAAVAVMLTVHRTARTWHNMVDVYVALTEFARGKFVEGGLPAERIVVKPNFVYPDPGPGTGRGGHAVFVGRLSPEKGLGTLLKAWEHLGRQLGPDAPKLKIVGDGPMAAQVADAASRTPGVQYLGRRPAAEAYDIIGEASVLVFPSQWYETFGRVAVEAFAKGTPVIASDLGAMAELVAPGRTGLLFRPGGAEDLAGQVRRLLSNRAALAAMRTEARREYEAKYTAKPNAARMLEIYHAAIRSFAARRPGNGPPGSPAAARAVVVGGKPVPPV